MLLSILYRRFEILIKFLNCEFEFFFFLYSENKNFVKMPLALGRVGNTPITQPLNTPK